MRLNFFGSVQSQFQHLGHFTLNSDKKAVCWSKVQASGVRESAPIFSFISSNFTQFLLI
jgi:hypothetical protein